MTTGPASATPAIDAALSIGHWTASDGATGCTVLVLPEGTVASGEVRGGAPATREFALLEPGRLVEHIDAVVLSGGSAFGLATADGVMQALAADGRGHPTRVRSVPIVVGMCLFDLAEGVEPPGAPEGRLAIAAAAAGPWQSVRQGAGAGATVAKWRDPDARRPGGLGIAGVRSGALEVLAVIAVNALGEVDDGTTVDEVLAGRHVTPTLDQDSFENTTIGAVITNGAFDKQACRLLAESAHDGLGRALIPAHSLGDGDAVVAASIGAVEAPLPTARLLATVAVERAVRSVAELDETPLRPA